MNLILSQNLRTTFHLSGLVSSTFSLLKSLKTLFYPQIVSENLFELVGRHQNIKRRSNRRVSSSLSSFFRRLSDSSTTSCDSVTELGFQKPKVIKQCVSLFVNSLGVFEGLEVEARDVVLELMEIGCESSRLKELSKCDFNKRKIICPVTAAKFSNFFTKQILNI